MEFGVFGTGVWRLVKFRVFDGQHLALATYSIATRPSCNIHCIYLYMPQVRTCLRNPVRLQELIGTGELISRYDAMPST